MILQQELISKIEAFLMRAEMSPTAFGKKALGDPNFVSDMREGSRAPNIRTIQAIEEFIKSGGAKIRTRSVRKKHKRLGERNA